MVREIELELVDGGCKWLWLIYTKKERIKKEREKEEIKLEDKMNMEHNVVLQTYTWSLSANSILLTVALLL